MKNSKPTIYDPAFLPNNIYSGVPSWLNLPVLENESELSSMDAVVTGVPWEGGCTIGGYSSCTEGPKAIRSVSIRYTGYLPDFDLDAFDYLKVGDFGDVACRNGDYPLTFAAIRERISQIDQLSVSILINNSVQKNLKEINYQTLVNPENTSFQTEKAAISSEIRGSVFNVPGIVSARIFSLDNVEIGCCP